MKIVVILLLSLSQYAMANEIALSFDDSPRGDGFLYTGSQRTQKLIEVLKKHNIQTVFFSNSERLESANGEQRLESYADAGHIIANHTHSHPDIRKTPVEEYIQDIDKADKLLSKFDTFTKWFRFPFLREGDDVQTRDRVRSYLSTNDYKNGYVTVDNYDYFVDHLVQKALEQKKKVNLDKACQMLVDVMLDGIRYYDGVAKKYIGSVRHVLLMHENDIEAYCLDKLIVGLQGSGWSIISPGRAFADPLMSTEPDTTYLGQGRVAAIAHVKSGIKHRSKWESTKALTDEFNKRKIVE